MNDEKASPEIIYQMDLSTLPEPQLTGHQWRQEGTQLICRSCSFEHGSFIDPGYQLYGIDHSGCALIRRVEVKP